MSPWKPVLEWHTGGCVSAHTLPPRGPLGLAERLSFSSCFSPLAHEGDSVGFFPPQYSWGCAALLKGACITVTRRGLPLALCARGSSWWPLAALAREWRKRQSEPSCVRFRGGQRFQDKDTWDVVECFPCLVNCHSTASAGTWYVLVWL